MLEGVFDLRSGLFGVALDLVAAALGAKAAAAGDAAEESLGTALERFGGVLGLLRDIHVIAFRQLVFGQSVGAPLSLADRLKVHAASRPGPWCTG